MGLGFGGLLGMERVRITKACDALDRPHPTGRKLCRFEPGTVLRLLREDEREFYKVAYLGMPVFVPRACAVGATKDEPLIEILGTTGAGEGAGATAPSSTDASRHTVDSDTPTDTAISEAPDSAPPPAPEARAKEAPVHTAARPASKPAAFVVPRWLRWLASQRVALQEQRTVDSENPLDAASSAAPVSSIPARTSAPAPPPSPPSGPPRGSKRSRRKLTAPLPPEPPSAQFIDEALVPRAQSSDGSSLSLMEVESFKRPEWEPLPHAGCHGVDHKVLVAQPNFVLVLLRFASNATIHEHPAQWPIDVYCLEGSGKFSLGGKAAAISAGQRVRWPPDVPHRLWTEHATMTTLMVENPPPR